MHINLYPGPLGKSLNPCLFQCLIDLGRAKILDNTLSSGIAAREMARVPIAINQIMNVNSNFFLIFFLLFCLPYT